MRKLLTMLALSCGLMVATFATDIGSNTASAHRWGGYGGQGWVGGGGMGYRRTWRPYAGYRAYGYYPGQYNSYYYGGYPSYGYSGYGYGYGSPYGTYYYGPRSGVNFGWYW